MNNKPEEIHEETINKLKSKSLFTCNILSSYYPRGYLTR